MKPNSTLKKINYESIYGGLIVEKCILLIERQQFKIVHCDFVKFYDIQIQNQLIINTYWLCSLLILPMII